MSSIGLRKRESLAGGGLAGGLASQSGSNGGPSSSSASSAPTSTSVQVAVRIRPLTQHDLGAIPTRWQRNVVQPLSSNSLQVESGGPPPSGAASTAPSSAAAGKKQSFTFDRVLSPNDGQETMYQTSAEPLIHRFLEGYNVTILAYGQTSSGKSYTMGTSAADMDFESLVAGQRPDADMGIIPRAVAQIFSQIKQNQAKSGAIQYSARASFIEIYNEELIDLLADADGDAKPLVQIREDKAGHIIWQGLREPKVSNVADVMNYLLQGSTIRRTNETDMNAQSSRSHAIFSLTLTQRKFVGSGAPPPPSAPSASGIRPPSSFGGRTTPTGRSTPLGPRGSSGLPRPTSSIPTPNRVSSPTASRPNTPGYGGLRPTSVMAGPRSPSAIGGGEEGEWVTVTSKFHFVDLAGSERLKRTAAQGERAKEGISINAGLHALGNVISALGDPAKAKRTTHIPYRDSKLTRLLQDSLGGNAHTLMIACVSPAEYNVSETVNTLQYAHRARNIKNKAELNEVEVGWDDVEYLQGVVVKLRKEMAILRNAKAGVPGSEAALRNMERKEELEWRDKYTALSQKHAQLMAEVAKLQQMTRNAGAQDKSSNADFLEAAEPIIVEYEKTVDALEGQINLLKAAVSHAEDVITEQEAELADKGAKLNSAEQDLEMRETTITELQGRLAKLQDREATADSYARDLENRLQAITSAGDQESQVTAELRKEVARLKEAETTTEQYVKELEARLSKADDSVASLQAQLDRLEREVSRRDEAYKELQQRLELLDNSKASKELLEELDDREHRLLDLGRKLDELQAERDDVVRERGKLNDAAAQHQLERGKLEDHIRTLETAAAAAAAAGLAGVAVGAVTRKAGHERSDSAAGAFDDAESGDESPASPKAPTASTDEVDALRRELEELRASENKAKAELDTLNAKYRESLSEIQDLSHQITEVKLNGGAPLTPQFRRGGGGGGAADEEELEVLDGPETQGRSEEGGRSLSRRSSWNQFSRPNQSTPSTSRGRPESLLLDTKKLSCRSSGSFLGYNPREQTPREGVPPSPIRSVLPGSRNGSRANSPTRPRTRSLSQSLSQELGLGGRRPLSLSHSGSLLSLVSPSRGSMSGSAETLTPFEYERQIASLRKESQRLQEVLQERDDEIAALEKRNGKLTVPNNNGEAVSYNESTTMERSASTVSNGSSDEGRFVDSMSALDSGMSTPPPLTPATERELSLIKQLIAETRAENIGGQGGDGAARLEELMRSMARKEASSREQIEDLTATVSTLQKERETLKNLARDQAVNMAAEIEGLRQKLGEKEGQVTPKSSNADLASSPDAALHRELESLRKQNHELKALAASASLAGVAGAAGAAVLANGHAQTDASREVPSGAPASQLAGEHVQKLAQLQDEHRSALEAAQKQSVEAADATREKHSRALEEQQLGHKAELDALAAKHAKVLLTTTQAHEASLQQRQVEHDDRISNLQNEHEKALATAQEEKRKLADEHALKLSQLSREHDSRLQELVAKHTAELNSVKDEHVSATNRLEAAQVAAVAAAVAASHKEHAQSLEGSEAERAEKHASALAALQNEAIQERTAALASAQERYAEELARQVEQHTAALAAKDKNHSNELAALRDQQEAQLASVQDSHAKKLAEQAKEHEAALLLAKRKTEELQGKHDAALRQLSQEHGDATAQLEADHQASISKLTKDQGHLITKMETDHQAAISKAKQEHGDASDKLRVEHAMALAQLQESHEQATFSARSEHSSALAAALALAAKKHEDERRRAIDELTEGHDKDMEELKAGHLATLEDLKVGHGDRADEHVAEVAKLKELHSGELAKLSKAHTDELAKLHDTHSAELDKHRRDAEALRAQLASHADKLKATSDRHVELERKHKEVSASFDELEASHKKLAEVDPAELDALRLELTETSDALVTLEGALTETQEERDRLAQELEAYKSGSADSGAISQHIETQAQLRKEAEKSQAALANIKTELLRSKSDIQGLLEERARQDSLLRETQIKLTIAETRGAGRARANGGGDGSTQSTPSDGGYASATGEFPPPTTSNRVKRYSPPEDLSSPTEQRSRNLSANSAKPPPLTPPPNMPPPPTPAGGSRLSRGSTASSATAAGAVGGAGRPESPVVLSRSSSTASINTKHASIASVAHADPKAARLLSEQADELRILAKQLSHCEQDLQANIDLVATLEAALNDSERNLRKSRVQLSEVTRERDRYAAEADDLRQQISMAQREADAVRNSVLLEKQGFESRLQAEREAKERARRALESRLEEVQRKKNSRLFCI